MDIKKKLKFEINVDKVRYRPIPSRIDKFGRRISLEFTRKISPI